MPRQNRVTPFSDFEASPARGLFTGNWGILHDDQGTYSSARWRHKNWIVCVLSFKERKTAINPLGHYTQLFFCDEATAIAAGHRPCAECRRPDFLWYMVAWQKAYGLQCPPKAGEADQALHKARVAEQMGWMALARRPQKLAARRCSGKSGKNPGAVWGLGVPGMKKGARAPIF
jgi:hypothetical protein